MDSPHGIVDEDHAGLLGAVLGDGVVDERLVDQLVHGRDAEHVVLGRAVASDRSAGGPHAHERHLGGVGERHDRERHGRVETAEQRRTFSRCTSSRAAMAPLAGLLSSSRTTSSTFLPSRPPLALISSTAMERPRTIASPDLADCPDMAATRPSLTVSCALDRRHAEGQRDSRGAGEQRTPAQGPREELRDHGCTFRNESPSSRRRKAYARSHTM